MAALEFVSSSGRDTANPQATAERLVNLYPEPLALGAQAQYALKSVLGTEAFASAEGVFVRALANVPAYIDAGEPADRLIMVDDAKIRSIGADGVVQTLGTVGDDENTSISGNNGSVTIVSDGNYWLWDGTALTNPTAGVFTNFGAVEFLGDYTILTEKNDRRFCWSALADPTDLPALNFATAEARDDILIRPAAIAGNLWLFKATSIEIWSGTGLSGADAFSRVGGVIETGLKSFGLLSKFPGGAFFIGDDGIAYITGGSQLQPISTPAVNSAIENCNPTSCFYYEDAGHKFCVIRFRDCAALVFDIATGAWHERATGEDGAWGATTAARAYGSWRFGGFNGYVRTATRSNNDVDAPLIRRALSRPLSRGRKPFTVPMLEILGQMGASDMGREAQVSLRVSRDAGKTFAPWRNTGLGLLGDYSARAIFRNLGYFTSVAVAEVRVTGAADLTIWSSAEVEVV